MGKFDGVLFCSDIDGTLTCGTTIPEKNVRALSYFMQEGGLFTVSTGRYPNFIFEQQFPVLPNTHIIAANGTVICDRHGKPLYNSQMDPNFVCSLISDARNIYEDFEFYYYNVDNPSITETCRNVPPKINCNKIVLMTATESGALRIKSELQKQYGNKVIAARSWPVGLEFIDGSAGKGFCVQYLKKMTGAKLLICAGDYENDIEMLQNADIGYAMGNALDSVKAVSDRITLTNENCGIANIIYELEQELETNGYARECLQKE